MLNFTSEVVHFLSKTDRSGSFILKHRTFLSVVWTGVVCVPARGGEETWFPSCFASWCTCSQSSWLTQRRVEGRSTSTHWLGWPDVPKKIYSPGLKAGKLAEKKKYRWHMAELIPLPVASQSALLLLFHACRKISHFFWSPFSLRLFPKELF